MKFVLKSLRHHVAELLRRAWLIAGVIADKLAARPREISIVCADELPISFLDELMGRIEFFAPGWPCQVKKELGFFGDLTAMPILIIGRSSIDSGVTFKIKTNYYFVDWRINPLDGWEWCRLTQNTSLNNVESAVAHGRAKLLALKKKLGTEPVLEKVYLFGTGPSLGKAIFRDWSDGLRVVCNTIVRDECLWRHIAPHIIVAGDAIYHFGDNAHSKQFRRDLLKRLQESDTIFLYPQIFHGIVVRELSTVKEKLVPIPQGVHGQIVVDLFKKYQLPADSNVLNLLLLPVGASFGKNIKFFGFDGRDPQARFFWRNSGNQSYPELMAGIRERHPAFFEYLVPSDNPTKYINDVHGLRLEKALILGENLGLSFEMLHPTWTATLAKWYLGDQSIEEYSQNILSEESQDL